MTMENRPGTDLTRETLPARRGHETFEFAFSRGPHDPGTDYTCGVGRSADGRITEVFLDCHKLSSAMTDDARDVAITLSVALQHGMTIQSFAAGMARLDDGQPCGLTGRLLDALLEHDGQPRLPRSASAG